MQNTLRPFEVFCPDCSIELKVILEDLGVGEWEILPDATIARFVKCGRCNQPVWRSA